MQFQSPILILPGLGNSGPQHWQSLWEKEYNFIRIEQKDWDTPVCDDWIENINLEIQKHNPAEVILVAHSLACIALAYWAKKFNVKIKAALLVAPSDTEAGSFPTGTNGFAPVPLIPLPFKTITVLSTNDFYVTTARAEQFANAWGSEIVNIGNADHINATAGFGPWEQGLQLLKLLDN